MEYLFVYVSKHMQTRLNSMLNFPSQQFTANMFPFDIALTLTPTLTLAFTLSLTLTLI